MTPDETPSLPPRQVLYGFYLLLFVIFVTVLVVVGKYT
jgi:hypothetical protein